MGRAWVSVFSSGLFSERLTRPARACSLKYGRGKEAERGLALDQDITARAENVCKYYGSVVALDGVSLELRRGEITGLLGPNGSGKSTFIKLLMGFMRPDHGRVVVLGQDPYDNPAVRTRVGYVPEELALYEALTPKEFFDLVARIRRLKPEDYEEHLSFLARSLGLWDRMDDLIGSLSRGNKQKVAIIAALLHGPELLLLDEPLTGLDPVVARITKEILYDMRDHGTSILFSTHILELAEAICDRIVILHRGRVVAEGTVEEILELAREKSLEEVFLEVTGKAHEVYEVVRALKGGA